MDDYFMQRSLELALQGWGRTNPNPLVGAVIVRDGLIIAEGWHARLGGDHAERAALNLADEAKVDVRGATLYVNLEPCSHYGRTPPCTETIIRHGIGEVVAAMADPNPQVAGSGFRQLEEAGIRVRTGVLASQARSLNEIFIKYVTTRTPFVIMKTAMTLDGKIASASGDSRWVSGEVSRGQVHRLRQRVAAIMAGSGTILADDPSLTARVAGEDSIDPIRVVVDSQGRIPLTSRVVRSESKARLILATTSRIDPEKEQQLLDLGHWVWKLDGPDGHVDLSRLMDRLGGQQIDSVLLEGGGGLNAAALQAGIVDKVQFFIAPKIIGGALAFTPVEGNGIGLMQDAIRLENMVASQSGEDWLIEGYPARSETHGRAGG